MRADKINSFRVLNIYSFTESPITGRTFTEEEKTVAIETLNEFEAYGKNGKVSEQDKRKIKKCMSLDVSEVLWNFKDGWQERMLQGVEHDRNLLTPDLSDKNPTEQPPEVDEQILESIRWNGKNEIHHSEQGANRSGKSFALREYDRLRHLFPSSYEQYVITFLKDRIGKSFKERIPGIQPSVVLHPWSEHESSGWSVRVRAERDKKGQPCLMIAFQGNGRKSREPRCVAVLGLKSNGGHKGFLNKNARIHREALEKANGNLSGRPALFDEVMGLLEIFSEKFPRLPIRNIEEELREYNQFDADKGCYVLRELVFQDDRIQIAPKDISQFQHALFKIVEAVPWRESSPYLLSLCRGFGSRILKSKKSKEDFYKKIKENFIIYEQAVRSDLDLLLKTRPILEIEDEKGARLATRCCRLREISPEHPAAVAAIEAFHDSLWSKEEEASNNAKALAQLFDSNGNDDQAPLKKIFYNAFTASFACLKTGPGMAEGLGALKDLLDDTIALDLFDSECLDSLGSSLKNLLVEPDPGCWITRNQMSGFWEGFVAFLSLVKLVKSKWQLDEWKWLCSPLPISTAKLPDRYPSSWFEPCREWLKNGSLESKNAGETGQDKVEDQSREYLKKYAWWVAQEFVLNMFTLDDPTSFKAQYQPKLNGFFNHSLAHAEQLPEEFLRTVIVVSFMFLEEDEYGEGIWERFKDIMKVLSEIFSADLGDAWPYLDTARSILDKHGEGLLALSFRKWSVDVLSSGFAGTEWARKKKDFISLFIQGLLAEERIELYEKKHQKAKELAKTAGFSFKNSKEFLNEYAGAVYSKPREDAEKRLALVAAFDNDGSNRRRFEDLTASYLYKSAKLEDTEKIALLKEALFDERSLKRRLQGLWLKEAEDKVLNEKQDTEWDKIFRTYAGEFSEQMKKDLCLRVLLELENRKDNHETVLTNLCNYLQMEIPEPFLKIRNSSAQLQMFSIFFLFPSVMRTRATAWGWASILKETYDSDAKADAELMADIGLKGL